MPIYERLDITTLRGSGRGRWRRNAASGVTAVMAAGVLGGGVAAAAPSTAAAGAHQPSPAAAHARPAQGTEQPGSGVK